MLTGRKCCFTYQVEFLLVLTVAVITSAEPGCFRSCRDLTRPLLTGKQEPPSTFYSAKNRALQNHAFYWQTASSAIICGRDCAVSSRCASFNYHTSTQVCELNNATKAAKLFDLITKPKSLYFDNSVDTSTYSAPYYTCKMLLKAGYHDSGIYTIFPVGMADSIQAYCDMQTDGGGWIVFQKRQDGSVDFYRNWTEYQSGFGYLSGEFWLGNAFLRILTSLGQWQLRVNMEDWEGNKAWAAYGEFSVSGQEYNLHVDSFDFSSTAGDAMSGHNGLRFITKDSAVQGTDECICARDYHGAWWFHCCHQSHLNGKYYHQANPGHGKSGHGVFWHTWKWSYFYSLKKCSMKIREVMTVN